MQSQNVNLIKPNKSSLPPDINIYQLPSLQPIQPPLFSRQAAQPLNLTYEQVKSLYKKPSNNQVNFLPSNKPLLPQKMSFPQFNNELQNIRNQNALLKQNLSQMTKLYQQQKFKYNELKNLYKEGQAMFQILEDKKITLQKQNKQLRSMLDNFYQQLHSENQHFQGQDKRKQQFNKIPQISNSFSNNVQSSTKIQKVKIGNKKIPVIKVNVPPQTFIKKQHSSSVFSQNSDFNSVQTNNNNNINYKEEISILKQEVQRLKGVNFELQRKFNDVKQDLSKSKRLIEEYEKKQTNKNIPFVTFKQPLFLEAKKQLINEKQHQNILSPLSFDFKFSKIQNHQFSQTFSQGNMSQFHQDRENHSYYKSKYNILETQVKKKDETIKNLYNQCYSLQAEINRLKTQSSSMQATLPGSSRDTRQSWTQEKHISHFNVHNQQKQPSEQKMNESFQSKGEWYYQSKINDLQKRVNELNQMCISNVNQTFRINELNDTIAKLTRENGQYEQKIMNQQEQLSRLYKILQNKNTQLSEIYTTITQSKRNYGLDESKKKSINNIFINTPEKNQQFSSQNLFYSKGYSKDQSFH